MPGKSKIRKSRKKKSKKQKPTVGAYKEDLEKSMTEMGYQRL